MLASNAVALSDLRVLSATDDAGKELTNAAGTTPFFFGPLREGRGEWCQTIGLRHPAKSAHMIQRLEGEVNLAIPTTSNGGRFTIENFMARPGEIIRDARLNQYGIKLIYHTLESYTDYRRAHPKKYVDNFDLYGEKRCFTGIYGNPTNPPRKLVAIHVEDPHRKLLEFSFERIHGEPIPATCTSASQHFRCYEFGTVPPKDVKLVVFVAAPGVVRTERFSLTNIWLPWDRSPGSPYADPPELRATAELRVFKGRKGTHADLHLTFTGGPITNAWSITGVTAWAATDENGKPVPLLEPAPTKRSWQPLRMDFSRVNVLASPKRAEKWLWLDEVPDAKWLRLEGDVEVFHPNSTNGGLAVFTNLLRLSGKTLTLPGRAAEATKLKFAGRVDFEQQRKALKNSPSGCFSYGNPPENPTNSLRFEIRSPDGCLVDLVFMDGSGKPLQPQIELRSSDTVIYNFRETLQNDWQLAVYLAAPDAIQLHNFHIERVLVKMINF